jgi:hypothetical protein
MASERADDPDQTRTSPLTWLDWYAEASRRRRQRGWHRRHDFSDQRQRRSRWPVITAGAALGLAVLAALIALITTR